MERGGERKEGRGGRVDDGNGGVLNEWMVKVGSEIPSTCKCYSPLHLVLVEGIKESQPLDTDTVLWNKNKSSTLRGKWWGIDLIYSCHITDFVLRNVL